jgi:HK97 gp10 family phage protein
MGKYSGRGWMSTEVTGMRELDRALSVLPDNIAQKVLKQAVAAGASVMKREAKRRCPKRTGRLAKSIAMKFKRIGRGSRRGRVFYQVGPKEKYGHLVEFGTGPHIIKPSVNRRIKLKARGEKVSDYWGLGYKGRFGKKVKHPGATAQPFLRPAFDESSDQIIKAMQRRIRTGVEKESRKLARKRIAARRAARRG